MYDDSEFTKGGEEEEMNKELLVFSSKRLIIRPLERKDYKAWKVGLEGTKAPQNAFDTDNCQFITPTNSTFLSILKNDKMRIAQGVTLNFFAFEKKTGDMVGGSQFWLIQRGDCQRATLGYSVLNQYWRKGYGFEIGDATIDHGIKVLGLNRIEAEILPENVQSIKLSEKLGMIKEGVKRKALFENGQWRDHVLLAITASDLGIVDRLPNATIKSIV